MTVTDIQVIGGHLDATGAQEEEHLPGTGMDEAGPAACHAVRYVTGEGGIAGVRFPAALLRPGSVRPRAPRDSGAGHHLEDPVLLHLAGHPPLLLGREARRNLHPSPGAPLRRREAAWFLMMGTDRRTPVEIDP